MGGGGFISLGANAIDLSTICTKDQECDISDSKYQNKDFTNTAPFSLKTINIQTQINTLTNASNLTSTDNQTIKIENNGKNGKLNHLTNTGNISGGIYINNQNALTKITNIGEMRGIWANGTQNITIDNRGIIKTAVGNYMSNQSNTPAHFMFEDGSSTLTIENYMIKIIETQSEFNEFSGYNDRWNNKNSHLIIWEHGSTYKFATFKDDKSKIILGVGSGFEFDKEYLISKLITNQSGTQLKNLNIDFSRLVLSDDVKDLYSLTNNGEYFTIKLLNKITETPITAIYKANIRTMNNFYTMSNAMIYPRKYSKSQNLRKLSLRADSQNLRGNPKDLRAKRSNHPPYENIVDSALDSANSLKSYESFAYRNESQTRRIQRQNKRNYSRTKRNNNLVILSDSEESKKKQNRDSSIASLTQNDNKRFSQNLAQNPHDYYFILTPFINHNYFFQSGRYNLSGFDYGFLTAFSARVAESNTLGAHFIMSYGSLGDSHDKDFRISNLNLNLGLNYKLDLVWDMYLKARGDFFYFLNQVKTLTMREAIKPNNLGFGVSVSYGKDFDFKQGGVLGIEAGIDYKALQSNKVELHDNTYQKQLYHLLYVDLGISYTKYFGNFGINVNFGIKGNITANKLAKSQIILKNLNRSVDMILDNDKILGYTNVALSYVLNHRNFDMEFSLAYYGNFGDRILSNGGGFEWRVGW